MFILKGDGNSNKNWFRIENDPEMLSAKEIKDSILKEAFLKDPDKTKEMMMTKL